jgi:hypothetical protein
MNHSYRAFLTYETSKARGQGFIRLKEEDGKFKRAYTFFTVSLLVPINVESRMLTYTNADHLGNQRP